MGEKKEKKEGKRSSLFKHSKGKRGRQILKALSYGVLPPPEEEGGRRKGSPGLRQVRGGWGRAGRRGGSSG